MTGYLIEVEPLTEEDGGGFLATAPDLPGCMSDGDTPEEAERNCRSAINEWIDYAMRRGQEVPPPSVSQTL